MHVRASVVFTVAFSFLSLVSKLAFGADENLVSTEAESLLALEGSLLPQDEAYLGVKDFLTCFVSNLDLPTQVYLDCGIAVAQSAINCRSGIWNLGCISSLVRAANKCALPLSSAFEGAKICWAAENPEVLPRTENQ